MKVLTKKKGYVPDKPWLAGDVYICPKGMEEDGEATFFCNAERL